MDIDELMDAQTMEKDRNNKKRNFKNKE